MPWGSKTVEDLRKEFVEAAIACDNLSKLCREFGISRPTAYKWLSRAENGEPLSIKAVRLSEKPAKQASKRSGLSSSCETTTQAGEARKSTRFF